MAAAAERVSFIVKPSEANKAEGEEDIVASSSCWDLLCCFRRRHDLGHLEQKSLLHGEQQEEEAWWLKKARSVKEFSEVLAGPKWKTFLRKFSNSFKKKRSQFQYDHHSYALNFDDDEEERDYPSFSTRFAAPPGKNSAPLVPQ